MGSSRISKIGVVAFVGAIAAVGMVAYSSMKQIQQPTQQTPQQFKLLQILQDALPDNTTTTDESFDSNDDYSAPTDPNAEVRDANFYCGILDDTNWGRLASEFQQVDTDGDWVVTSDELSVVISNEDELEWVLNVTDFNGDRNITVDELCQRVYLENQAAQDYSTNDTDVSSDNSTSSDDSDGYSDDSTEDEWDFWAYYRSNVGYCNQLNDDNWGQVENVFKAVDVNGDYEIDLDELTNYFNTNGISADPAAAIEELDLYDDNEISIWELCASALDYQNSQDPEYRPQPTYDDYQTEANYQCPTYKSWDRSSAGFYLYLMDSNYDWVVSQVEYTNYYGSDEYVLDAFLAADLNEDGVLDLPELCEVQGDPAINYVDDYTTFDYEDLPALLDAYCPYYDENTQWTSVYHFAPTDTNRDGVTTWDEFYNAYPFINPTYSWEEAYYEFQYTDSNRDGVVDLGEACYANSGREKIFSHFTQTHQAMVLYKSQPRFVALETVTDGSDSFCPALGSDAYNYQEALQMIDADGDEEITIEEWFNFFVEYQPDADFDEIEYQFYNLDLNGDDVISFSEVCEVYSPLYEDDSEDDYSDDSEEYTLEEIYCPDFESDIYQTTVAIIQSFDQNGDWSICRHEYDDFVYYNDIDVSEEDLETDWFNADIDMNGKVDFGEVCRLVYWEQEDTDDADYDDGDDVDEDGEDTNSSGFEDVADDEISGDNDSGLDEVTDDAADGAVDGSTDDATTTA